MLYYAHNTCTIEKTNKLGCSKIMSVNNTQSRVKNSFRNTVFGFLGLLLYQVFNFATRSVFIRLLGAEYNGVNGLFSNVLQILNLAELGFATSIGYALYKPLKSGDERTTAALMNFFAKVYRIIAVVVGVIGCCCIPFLQYLIAEDMSELSFSIVELRGYFAMYLASTVCSYLLAYKRSIISADQRNYLISNVDNLCNILLNVAQIIMLLITKNFYAYLSIMIAKTVINNLVIHIIAGKKYPYLKAYVKEKLPKAEKSIIFKNVQAAFLHRIGSVIIYSTTSVVISAFVSLIEAGQYSNYIMIVSGVNSFINIIFNSVTASIGNLCVDESEDRQYDIFKKVRYLALFSGVFSYVCYIILFNPFIEIWVGEDMVMSMWVVFAISLNTMIEYLRKAVNTFKDAKGMFRNDWYKPLLEAGVGLGLAIGLSYVWGTFGVIMGYTLATMFIAVPVENYVLFRQGLHRPFLKQLLILVGVMVFAFAVGAAGYFIGTFIPSGIGWFVLRFVFAVVFAAGAFILVTIKTPEFKYFVNLAAKLLKGFGKKVKSAFSRKKNVAVSDVNVMEGSDKDNKIINESNESSTDKIAEEKQNNGGNDSQSDD